MLKETLVDLDDLGIDPDNMEGDGLWANAALTAGNCSSLVSDNNFNPGQTTQFVALAVELE